MKLTHSCIVTNNVKNLVNFYEKVLNEKAQLYGENYAEFKLGDNILAIYDLTEHNKTAPNSLKHASNKSMILELSVDDVDKEYERLLNLGVTIIKKPSNQEWGNRSMYFLDPDGNFIDFYQTKK